MMHLSRFLERHPRCVVGRPDWLSPLIGFSASLAASLACAAGAWSLRKDAFLAVLFLACAAVAAVLALRRLTPFREAASHALGGRACFAIADREVLLVGASGNAVVVEVECISELVLAGREPRLKTDAQAEALVYAAMFELFDEEAVGPDGERFFQALAPRLRPGATISRRDGCDDPLLVG